MIKEQIYIKNSIVHILNSETGTKILSDSELSKGSDFTEFLKQHIYKTSSSDDARNCIFQDNSYVYAQIQQFAKNPDSYIAVSKKIADRLYEVMQRNPDIPPADFIVCYFMESQEPYLALLKMNYKTTYTHKTANGENDIVKFKTVLPGAGQKIQEAAVISLKNFQIRLIEKKYAINGVKTNYFSTIFLECDGKLSPNKKLAVMTKEIRAVQKKHYDEQQQCKAQMETKKIFHENLEEKGGIVIENVLEEVFCNDPECKEEVKERLSKHVKMESFIQTQDDKTAKKYETQHLVTDSGVELKIPMDCYKDKNRFEFITEPDGTISVILRQIGHIETN